MGTEKQVQKVELPEPTDAELKSQSYQEAMIIAILDSGGYKINTSQVQTYENPDRINTLQSSVDSLTQQKQSLEAQLQDLSKRGYGGYVGQYQTVQSQLNEVNQQLIKASQNLADEQSNVTTKYTSEVIKKEDQRVQSLRDQGKDSEADALKAQLDQQQLENLNKQDQINSAFLDAAYKVVSGDISITPLQEAQVAAFRDEYSAPILAAIDQIRSEIGATESSTLASLDEQAALIQANKGNITKALDSLMERIKQTGLETGDALIEAEARAKQNGVDMTTALEQSIAASRALTEQNLFDTTKDLRLANAKLMSRLGRATTDPAAIERLNEQLLSARSAADLNLAAQAASGTFQISQQTANALQSIADYRVQLTQTQGGKLENVMQTKAQLEGDTGNQLLGVQQAKTETISNSGLRREDVAKLRAGVEENASKIASSLRLNIANPMTAIQGGTSAINTIQGLNAIPMQSLVTANQPLTTQIQQQNQLRMAQPTTTTTTSGSFLSQLFSGLGVAAELGGTAAKFVLGGTAAKFV